MNNFYDILENDKQLFTRFILLFRKFTLDEVVAIVEHDDDGETVEVYIEPPEANVLTDEDSADDDVDVNHLSGAQLRAYAEIKSKNSSKADNETYLDANELLHSSKSLEWMKRKDIEPRSPIFPAGNYTPYIDFTPFELFELFFDDSLIEHVLIETNRYATVQKNVRCDYTLREVKVFFRHTTSFWL